MHASDPMRCHATRCNNVARCDASACSFKVLQGAKTTIGVVLHNTMGGYVNKTAAGWGYYMANGKVGHDGPAKRVYGPP